MNLKSIMKVRNIIIITLLITSTGCKISKQISQHKISWLNGTWQGTGYQIDLENDNEWSILLEIDTNNQLYTIAYPSLNCSGKWKLIKSSKDQATFEELIELNTVDCTQNGKVILSKVDDDHVIFSYFYTNTKFGNTKKASVFSTLEKQK